jgi:beta-lactamase superfamily II metal-dependent hydrolase
MLRNKLAALLCLSTLTSALAAPPNDLRIVSTDVEGAAAILIKTPEGQSVLIDTGWAPGQGSPQAASQPTSADRIAQAAATLGVTRIDYLIMTHYHADHLGGLEALLARLSVDTFVDHGPNLEPMRPNPTPQQRANAPETRYSAWTAAWQGHRHLSVRAGEMLDVGSLRIRFVASDGAVLDSALPGAGTSNSACANVPPPPRVGGDENNRSLGMLVTFGPTRILNLGDLTWEKEIALLCPTNKIGKVDVYFVTGHGMGLSSSPPTAALEPRVAIMQNGPLKGGDADVIQTVQAYPGLEGFWRTHDTVRYPALNGDPNYIANRDGVPDQGNAITLDITPTGAITVKNLRNSFSRTYRARATR